MVLPHLWVGLGQGSGLVVPNPVGSIISYLLGRGEWGREDRSQQAEVSLSQMQTALSYFPGHILPVSYK